MGWGGVGHWGDGGGAAGVLVSLPWGGVLGGGQRCVLVDAGGCGAAGGVGGWGALGGGFVGGGRGRPGWGVGDWREGGGWGVGCGGGGGSGGGGAGVGVGGGGMWGVGWTTTKQKLPFYNVWSVAFFF